MCFSCLDLSATEIFFMFLQMGLDRAEFIQKLVVLQDLQILYMEVSFIVTLEALVWLPWVDALQDAKLAEVLQIDLQRADSI